MTGDQIGSKSARRWDSTDLVKRGQRDSPFPTVYPDRNGAVKKRKSPEWGVKDKERRKISWQGVPFYSSVDHLTQSASRRDYIPRRPTFPLTMRTTPTSTLP